MANRREFISKLIGKMNTARGLREFSADVTPKTTETLQALCTAEKGVGLSSMPLRHYGSSFKRVVPGLKSHRVVPGFMSQGEIFTRGYASGGVQQVKDESLKHSGFGTRSIANAKRSSLATEFEEIMADYVHHEITRTWILVLMRLFVIIAMKDIFVHLIFAEPEDHED